MLTGQYAQAAALLGRMANSGNAEAQYQLASLYRSGRGVPLDEALAFKWMKAAAERGHARAQFNLGSMYLAGRGVGRDIDQARTWLNKAKAQGYQDADLLLSNLAARPSKDLAAAPARDIPIGPAPIAPSANATPKATSENGRPLILDAALRGQADAVRQLIASGADIASRDDDGSTALALAAAAGQVAALDVLLSAGAEVDARNTSGETALMRAAAKGHSDAVERLLENKADATATRPGGASALSMAVRGCHDPVVRTLISHGADTGPVLEGGMSLLMLAAACDGRVRLLAGDDFDQRSRSTRVALWLAAGRAIGVVGCRRCRPIRELPTRTARCRYALQAGAPRPPRSCSARQGIEAARRPATRRDPGRAGGLKRSSDLLTGARRAMPRTIGATPPMIATARAGSELPPRSSRPAPIEASRNKKRETAGDIAARLDANIAQMLKWHRGSRLDSPPSA